MVPKDNKYIESHKNNHNSIKIYKLRQYFIKKQIKARKIFGYSSMLQLATVWYTPDCINITVLSYRFSHFIHLFKSIYKINSDWWMSTTHMSVPSDQSLPC